jgi:apolipoprotein D and lipocalin family protein
MHRCPITHHSTRTGAIKPRQSVNSDERRIKGKRLMQRFLLFFLILIAGCSGIPQGVKPVQNFMIKEYLGKWYEIARLDHSFERGLTQVTADYTLLDDGGVKVVNRGYSANDKSLKEVEGKAYFVNGPDQGYLKVSFFGPFYGSYIVFELDHENYQYSLVCGPDKSYLWLLSRTPVITDSIKGMLIKKAESLGFDTSKLIFVKHGKVA